MTLDAIISRQGFVSTVSSSSRMASKILSYVGSVGYTGVWVANPIQDAKRVLTSAKNLGSSFASSLAQLLTRKKSIGKTIAGSWNAYFSNLKQGHWLGSGDISTILFYTGLATSGVYVPLLTTRFGIGAGAHIAKSIAAWDPIKRAIAYSAEVASTPLAAAGAAVGIPYAASKRSLKRSNVRKSIEAMCDNAAFREKIAPIVLDAVIGLKSYAGLVGAKWIAGTTEATARAVEKASGFRIITYCSRGMARVAGFVKNAVSDYLSVKVFSAGLVDSQSLDEKVKQWSSPDYAGEHPLWGAIISGNLKDYMASGHAVEDLKDGIASGFSSVKEAAVSWLQSAFSTDNIKSAVSSVASALAYPFDGRMSGDIQKVQQYLSNGGYRADLAQLADQKAHNLNKELVYTGSVIKHVALQNLGALANATGINPTEKYALVITASDDGGNTPMFSSMQHTAYDELVKQGFKPDHIRVMHWTECSKGSIEHAVQEMAGKMDWNDIAVEILQTHGHQDHQFDGEKYTSFSTAQIEATGEQLTEQDLRHLHTLYNSGYVLALMVPCQSGTFPNTSTDRVFVISSSNQENAWTGTYSGLDYMNRLLQEAGKHGGIASYSDIFNLMRLCKRTTGIHNNDMGHHQDPQVGFGGVRDGVKDLKN